MSPPHLKAHRGEGFWSLTTGTGCSQNLWGVASLLPLGTAGIQPTCLPSHCQGDQAAFNAPSLLRVLQNGIPHISLFLPPSLADHQALWTLTTWAKCCSWPPGCTPSVSGGQCFPCSPLRKLLGGLFGRWRQGDSPPASSRALGDPPLHSLTESPAPCTLALWQCCACPSSPLLTNGLNSSWFF